MRLANVIEAHEHKGAFCEALHAEVDSEKPLTANAQIFILGAREKKF
jgi:hypothetical protein